MNTNSISTRLQNRAILIFSLLISLLFAVYVKAELKKKEAEEPKPKTIVVTPVGP
jgi:hypothetical protein